ncbi:MAG: DUF4293 domain-containing protein [Crocinitomicaceae bacterium]
MIQRIQTIYLTLALICMSLLILFPLFSVDATSQGVQISGEMNSHGFAITETPTLDENGMSFEKPEPIDLPIYLIFMSLALITAASIMLYKNRKRQLLFCRLNFILHLLLVISFYAFYYLGQEALAKAMTERAGESVDVAFNMEIGFYLLIPTIPFLYLAIRGIKNDEKLLKSIDRIR